MVNRQEEITSVRRAAAVCNVTLPVVRRWLSLGLIPGPPWTRAQLLEVRDLTDPKGRRRGNRGAHGTITKWNAGSSCTRCRRYQRDTAKTRGRARARKRLPDEARQQLLDAICDGQPFRTVLRENDLLKLEQAGKERERAAQEELTRRAQHATKINQRLRSTR